MNKTFILWLFILLQAVPSIGQTGSPIEIGTAHTIQSDILQEERSYSLSLPLSYENDPFYQDRAYPILVVLDGERLFQQTTTVVHALSQGSVERMPEMIVVGVHNTQRNRDMLPTRGGESNSSEADFLSFLEEELLPHVGERYRTLNCYVMVGHSYAGLFTVNTFLKDSKFQAFLAIDPSLHWDGAVVVNKTKSCLPASRHTSLYIAQANNPFNPGEKSGGKAQAIQSFQQILDSLAISDLLHKLDFFEKEDHFSIPLISLYEGLGFLFKGYQFPLEELATTSQENLQAHYDQLGKRLGGNLLVPGKLLQQVAYFLLQQGNAQQALTIFSFTSQVFPTAYPPFEGLGQAYASLHQEAQAKIAFQKVLELNPASEVANRFMADH